MPDDDGLCSLQDLMDAVPAGSVVMVIHPEHDAMLWTDQMPIEGIDPPLMSVMRVLAEKLCQDPVFVQGLLDEHLATLEPVVMH